MTFVGSVVVFLFGRIGVHMCVSVCICVCVCKGGGLFCPGTYLVPVWLRK